MSFDVPLYQLSLKAGLLPSCVVNLAPFDSVRGIGRRQGGRAAFYLEVFIFSSICTRLACRPLRFISSPPTTLAPPQHSSSLSYRSSPRSPFDLSDRLSCFLFFPALTTLFISVFHSLAPWFTASFLTSLTSRSSFPRPPTKLIQTNQNGKINSNTSTYRNNTPESP